MDASAGASQLQQQMLGGAEAGVRFTSTPGELLPSLPPSLPYINGIMKHCQTLCFDSYERARESFPPRLEKVTAELRLCHRGPISEGRSAQGPVGCSPAEPAAPAQPKIQLPF